jgi:hypothetical protein
VRRLDPYLFRRSLDRPVSFGAQLPDPLSEQSPNAFEAWGIDVMARL